MRVTDIATLAFNSGIRVGKNPTVKNTRKGDTLLLMYPPLVYLACQSTGRDSHVIQSSQSEWRQLPLKGLDRCSPVRLSGETSRTPHRLLNVQQSGNFEDERKGRRN